MKPVSTDLFDLIRSLSQHEKSYFKRHATLHSKDGGSYVLLFEAINKQTEYKEELLKKALKGEKLISYLPRAKNYLYQKILESMRSYNDYSTEMHLRNALSDLDLLIKKSLYSQHQKLLKKALQLAEESENWLYYILLWKHKIQAAARQSYVNLSSKDFDYEQSMINNIANLETEKIQNLLLQTEVRKFALMEGKNIELSLPERVEHIQNALEHNEFNTKESEIYLLFAQANHLYTIQKFVESIEWYQKFLDTIEQYPHILSRNLYLYITGLEHWIGIGGRLMDKNLVNEVHRFLKILKSHKRYLTENDRAKIMASYYFLQIKYQYDFCLYEENKYEALIEEMFKNLRNHWSAMPMQQVMLMSLYCSLLYFAHQRYDKAQEWIDKVLDIEDSALRYDLISQAYVFRCIFHLEQKDYKYF